jgi:hypothetical protein
MHHNKLFKLMGINLALAGLNLVLYSKTFLGSRVGESALFTIFAILVSLASVAAFLWLNVKYLFLDGGVEGVGTKELLSAVVGGDDSGGSRAVAAREKELLDFADGRGIPFRDDLKQLSRQMGNLSLKTASIRKGLSERFQPRELTYQKFAQAVEQVEDRMVANAGGLMKKLGGYDFGEYEDAVNDPHTDREVLKKKIEVKDEYANYVRETVRAGNGVLDKLDKLLLELNKIPSFDERDGQNEEALGELDSVIADMKLYRDETE